MRYKDQSPGGFTAIDWQLGALLRRLAGPVEEAQLLEVSAALVSRERGRGHSCLRLGEEAGRWINTRERRFHLPALSAWRRALESSSLVAVPTSTANVLPSGEAKPLVLDGDRLYLWRYWSAEQRIARRIAELARWPRDDVDGSEVTEPVSELWRRLFPEAADGIDWQAAAAATALRSPLTLVSGGPGTGKTTTVVRLLTLLRFADPGLRLALAAPTGKAAARLEEAIAGQLATLDELLPDIEIRQRLGGEADGPLRASTLHRLLGYSPSRDRFRRNRQSPLTCGLLVVDEASMVDLLMMDALLDALPAGARLVLLGDQDQLASVEAGFVFGDLCTAAGLRGTAPEIADIGPAESVEVEFDGADWAGPAPEWTEPGTPGDPVLDADIADAESPGDLPPVPELHRSGPADWQYDSSARAGASPAPTRSLARLSSSQAELYRQMGGSSELPVRSAEGSAVLAGRGVELQISYRFRDRPGIGALASALRSSDPDGALRALDDPELEEVRRIDPPSSPELALSSLEPWLEKYLRSSSPGEALAALDGFRILCATRRGRWGTHSLNAAVESLLSRTAGLTADAAGFYRGQPILVEANDYSAQLFNGDLGVCWSEGDPDALGVYFRGPEEELRRMPIAKLPRHSTAWAMTVHKSQGTELDRVLLVLGEDDPAGRISRELVYTGVTRARQEVDVVTTASLLTGAIRRSIRRTTGLAQALSAHISPQVGDD